MTLPRFIPCALLLTGCIVDSKSIGEGETSGDDAPPEATSTVGDSVGETDGATGVADDDYGATTGSSCGAPPPDVCAETACDPGCDATEICIDDVAWECACECNDAGPGDTGGDTGPDGLCDIVPVAEEIAGNDAIDCGDVTPDDDDAAWQAAFECAVAAASEPAPFHLVVSIQGIDSMPRRAFGGSLVPKPEGGDGGAPGYQRWLLAQDTGGFVPPPPAVVTYIPCDAIVPTPGCTPAVGEICLTCEGDPDSEVLCEE